MADAKAAELIDFRVRITERANQVSDALARADSTDKAEIARRALDVWAEQEIHKAQLICRLTRTKGMHCGTVAANRGEDA